MKNKLLVIYNTCGMNLDAPYIIDYYINSIEGLLEQDFEDYKIVLSMYKNSLKCKKVLAQRFGNKISYVFYDEGLLTVNQTFNKTIQLCVEKFGKFEGYFYVNSGMTFGPCRTTTHPVHGSAYYDRDPNILKKLYETFKSGPYSMATVLVDWDAGFSQIGFKYDSGPPAQIQGEDFIIPVGKAVNAHIQIYSHEFYEAYGRRVVPDVFAAYCSESIHSFLNAAIKKKWVIMKDIILHHQGTLEGSSSASFPHRSLKYGNPWNNLLHGRSALDFINDPEAIEAGLGYEECNQIMMHKEEAFDENGYAKYPEKLKEIIKKYFFLSKDEFDYDKIICKHILNYKS